MLLIHPMNDGCFNRHQELAPVVHGHAVIAADIACCERTTTAQKSPRCERGLTSGRLVIVVRTDCRRSLNDEGRADLRIDGDSGFVATIARLSSYRDPIQRYGLMMVPD